MYLQRTAFGGKVRGRNFGVSLDSGSRFDLSTLSSTLEAVHERLSGVVIENLPFDEFIPRYERPDALLYCDPPYWGCEDDYGKNMFSRSDFARLRDCLAAYRGRWIVSINDVPEIREVFSGFEITPVKVSYSIAAGAVTEAAELLVSNFAHPLLSGNGTTPG